MKYKVIIIFAFLILDTYIVSAVIDSVLVDSVKTLNNLGIDHFYNGDYEKAEELLRNSLRIKKNIYPSNDIKIANSYNNLGVLNLNRWQFNIALEYFNIAKNIYEENKNKAVIANIYSNIGNVHRLKGDYTQAAEYYSKTIETLKGESTPIAIKRRAEVLNRFSLLEIQRKNYNSAVSLINSALNEFHFDIEVADKMVTYHNLLSTAYTAYELSGKTDSSIMFLNRSIDLFNTQPNQTNQNLSNTYRKLTMHYLHSGQLDLGYAALKNTHTIFSDFALDSLLYFDIAILYAEYYKLKKNYTLAIDYYNQAEKVITKEDYSSSSRYYFSNVKAISLLRDRARCFIEWHLSSQVSNYLLEALENLKKSAKLIDQSRNSYLSIESKLLLAENESEVYEMGFSCAYQLFEITKNDKYLNDAFYFAEKGKSSVLSGAITEERAKSFANIPAHLIQKEQALKRELAFYNEKIYTENTKRKPDTIKLATWKNYLFDYSRENEELKQLLERQYPAYFKLKYKDTFTGISRIQKKLDRSTTLIEYTLTDSILYTFVINKNEIYLYKSPCKDSLKKNIRNFVASFNQFDFTSQGANTYRDYENQSHTIYKSLLGFIPDDILKKNLVIVPDGILSYIPFEALVIKKNKTAPESFAAMNYLVLNHPVYYSYSAGLYVDAIDHTSRKFRNETLAVAPEYNYKPRGTIKYTHNNEAPPVRNSLHPLPHALKEVELVAELTNGDVISGKEATEPYFVKEAPRYDVLHLAMHTLIDDNNPLYSKLVFYNKEYTSDAGLLTTNEIFALRLKAKLTVLSACSSGEGEYNKGEGVMSLSRGFFYAGCPSLIMTLWKVEDKSGQLLMKAYYKYLIKGYSKSAALQKAKKEYILLAMEQNKHPFFWASYILIGNNKPIYLSYLWPIGIGVLVILMFFAGRRIRKKKPELPQPTVA